MTLVCNQRIRLFQTERNATLVVDTVLRYRAEKRFLLHGFVVMPNHVHLLFTPNASLEQAVGFIKGGCSFAVRRSYKGAVWQDGYYDHRVRDADDYISQLKYIEENPLRRRYEDYPYVHTCFASCLDGLPEHLGG